jgi:hypothetical protein
MIARACLSFLRDIGAWMKILSGDVYMSRTASYLKWANTPTHPPSGFLSQLCAKTVIVHVYLITNTSN